MTIPDEISEDTLPEVAAGELERNSTKSFILIFFYFNAENIHVGKSNFVEKNKNTGFCELAQDYTSEDKSWKVPKGTLVERVPCTPKKGSDGTEL